MMINASNQDTQNQIIEKACQSMISRKEVPMSEENLTNNPKLNGIDPAKLQMLMALANQGKGKGMNEMMPFMMAAMSQAQNSGMSFNNSEMDLIIEALKMGKSPEEQKQIDYVKNMASMMAPKKP